MFYVTTRALKHHGRNAILLDPTSYSSVATDAATHVLMNVFARNRNTYPSFFHTQKGTREGTFYFLIIERTIEQRSEGKNHNFPRKKKKNKRKIYHLGRNFIYFESRFNYQNEGWPSPSCNHRVLWNVSSRVENDGARSKVETIEDSRSLAFPTWHVPF